MGAVCRGGTPRWALAVSRLEEWGSIPIIWEKTKEVIKGFVREKVRKWRWGRVGVGWKGGKQTKFTDVRSMPTAIT